MTPQSIIGCLLLGAAVVWAVVGWVWPHVASRARGGAADERPLLAAALCLLRDHVRRIYCTVERSDMYDDAIEALSTLILMPVADEDDGDA